MSNLLNWLDGKKAYIVAGLTVVVAGLEATGQVVPASVLVGLAGLFGLSLRHSIAKLQKPVA